MENTTRKENTAAEYAIATAAGLLGGPLGLIASPVVLHFVGKSLQGAKKWLTWAGIGVLAAPLLAASTNAVLNPDAVTSDRATSSTEITSAPTTTEQPAEDAVPGIGDRITVDNRGIAVSEVKTQLGLVPQNQFADAIDGTIVLVYFTVENTGQESGNIAFSTFELKDAQGRSYDELSALDVGIWKEEQGLKSRSEDLFPGESRQDVAVFRVAPDASGYVLEWKGQAIDLR